MEYIKHLGIVLPEKKTFFKNSIKCTSSVYLNKQSIYTDNLCLNLNIKCNFKLKLIFDRLSTYTIGLFAIRGMFEMNCLLSSSSISTRGTIKTNTYLYRVIQYLHNGV